MNRIYADFARLLDSDPSEEDLHRFLYRHTYLLAGLGPMGADPMIFSKPVFGRNFKADFALTGSGNYRVWTFVEIERSTHSLFTKEGLPSQALNRAISQINSWWIWSHDYGEYVRAEYPDLHGEFDAVVVIGRRSKLSELDVRRLKHFNATQLAGKLRVLTYDVLLDRLADIKNGDLRGLERQHRQMTRYPSVSAWQVEVAERLREIRAKNELSRPARAAKKTDK